jgi:hypothetical protein
MMSCFPSVSILLLLLIDLRALALQQVTNSGTRNQNNQKSRTCVESFSPVTTESEDDNQRRAFLVTAGSITGISIGRSPVWARTPGSKSVKEAVDQISNAAEDLRRLQSNWDKYAVIDDEGRAVGDATILARRILGGVAPKAGETAIEVAKATPLYRIDGALKAIREAAIYGSSDPNDDVWLADLDLPAFEELSDRIIFQLQKVDNDFYSVQFAAKGTAQISGIFKEAKSQVEQGVQDFEAIKALLKEAGAPRLQ